MYFQRTVRRLSAMSSPKSNVSPFSRAVVAAMRKLYPEKLADSSFDNTGLLLEAPYRSDNKLRNSALLTIDLTKKVADEAIAKKVSIIVTYHPIIFRPLKSLTQANTQQNTLLRLAQEGISVYSPHTAVDAAPGGLNDWLVEALTRDFDNPEIEYVLDFTTSVITLVKEPPPGFEGAGYGRIIRFSQPQELRSLIRKLTTNLHYYIEVSEHKSVMRNPAGESLCVATPQSVPKGQKGDIMISTVGLCAGSGGSMLNGLDVDLLFTGELSHHEALAATEQGRCVITVFHSNSERGFLFHRMQAALTTALKQEIAESPLAFGVKTAAGGIDQKFKVRISTADMDPFEVLNPSTLNEDEDDVW